MVASDLAGYHLRFDGCMADRMPQETVEALIDELVSLTGLTKMGALMYHETDTGVYAIQGIAESHVSLHHENGGLFIDVFSCREFDAGDCVSLLGQLSPAAWSVDFRRREA